MDNKALDLKYDKVEKEILRFRESHLFFISRTQVMLYTYIDSLTFFADI